MVESASNTNADTLAPRQLPWKGALVMVAAVVAFYLLREHWSHVAGSAAYLLLLACPLMHLFGHGHGQGHGHRRGQGNHHGGSAGKSDQKNSREGSF